jgi:DNA primase
LGGAMLGFFSQEFLDEVCEKNDIVDVISGYVPLKSKGSRMWGCCPFHQEKTPSFSVNPAQQFYYCFGCHAGGNVIHFVMEMEKLSFPDSVRLLADRCGMTYETQGDESAYKRQREEKERLYGIVKIAGRYFYDRLWDEQGGAGAREYLARRGMKGSTVRQFGMGYAPDGWEGLVQHLTEKGCDLERAASLGLIHKGKKKEGYYDAFRNRVIFPIILPNNRVIGFGGRVLDQSLPKYINSPESKIFVKGEHLYGLRQLKKQRDVDAVFLVEGYMDVVSLANSGVTNAVASLGTALTEQQARLLKRYVSRVYLSYDGDGAGRKATLRGLDILRGEGLDVRVMRMPDGKDPDEFIRAEGKEAFLELSRGAMELVRYKLTLLEEAADLSTPEGRMDFAEKSCAMLARDVKTALELDLYGEYVCQRSGFALETVKNRVGQLQQKKPAKVPVKAMERLTENKNAAGRYNKEEQEARSERLMEQKLLYIWMQYPFVRERVDVTKDDFLLEEHGRLFEEIVKGVGSWDELLGGITDGEWAKVVAAVEKEQVPAKEALDMAELLVNRLKQRRIQQRIRDLQDGFPKAEPSRRQEILQELEGLNKQYRSLKEWTQRRETLEK